EINRKIPTPPVFPATSPGTPGTSTRSLP
ncbi:MAG: hypothetical protein JWR42_1229, partial [Marmoricola sp.]|nr:hypothetical protein [Marmoricola sp.]